MNEWTTRPAAPEAPAVPRLALTVPEAAAAVGVSPRLVWGALSAGELRGVRVGRRRLILVEQLRAWLLSKTERGSAPEA
jgi:excisionase family DNA binding protein